MNFDANTMRLESEAVHSGHRRAKVSHYKRQKDPILLKSETKEITILVGGLTLKHEKLIQAAWQGLGFKIEILPTPNIDAFRTGKEYGNNGQCNPTYFTVGNLVNYLRQLEASGVPRAEIVKNYIFLTAGACGPCRFGMYEAEYLTALRSSGFEGFRVVLFQQEGGLDQADLEYGLDMNLDFFLGLINALNIGDLMNDMTYQIRPFEVNKGETDRVMAECMDLLFDAFKNHRPWQVKGKFLKKTKLLDKSNYAVKFLSQLYRKNYTNTLKEIRRRINTIKIDRTRVKPIVKVTGEFWAQTTEGDGNFNMFSFLEKENAQVVVEPIGTWLLYMMFQARQFHKDRERTGVDYSQGKLRRTVSAFRRKISVRKITLMLTVAEKILQREWNRFRKALGNLPHALIDQNELARLAAPFYNTRADGGEGHLEVSKNIYYSVNHLCHMVLSVKPFGCMPSTQSDGVQAAVMGRFKDILFLPIETSGEGEINAHSRVQMTLGDARMKARKEFETVLHDSGFTLDAIKLYIDANPELSTPFYRVPHYKGIAGTAANFVKHVSLRMRARQK